MQVTLLNKQARVPMRGSLEAAGYDLYCCSEVVIPAGHIVTKVPIGIAIALPPHSFGRVAPRSGLALRGIDVMAGIIDEDYRGEISVLLINFDANEILFKPGDRIAQLIIQPYLAPQITVVDFLPDTERGSGGFGSTG